MRIRYGPVTETHEVAYYQCQSATCPNGVDGAPAEARNPNDPDSRWLLIDSLSGQRLTAWFDTPACLATWATAELPALLVPVIQPLPDPVTGP